MKAPNKDNTGCVDHEEGIQLECANCPPCYKGTKEVCEMIKTQINQTVCCGK